MTFSGMPRGGNFCIKLISIFLIPTFILSNLAYAAPTTDPVKTPAQNITVTNPESIVVPREFGLVKSKFTGKDNRLVIHIQDAHCNYEAQSNIVKILETLHKNYNVSLVSVEGADGVIDTSWFKAFPDDEVRKEVADYFMKKGEITGPEFLSITTDYNIKLFGAETRSYYIDNLNAFTSSYPLKSETEKYLNSIRSALNRLKTFIYSEDLRLMDAKYQDYDSKKLAFNDYVKFLQAEAEKAKINLRAYDNFFKLANVLIYEKKIDFTVTDKERSALIDAISKVIPKDALTELVNKSLEFKTGKVSSADYYTYLRSLATANGFDLAKDYPNLYNYTIYNSVYSRIENEKLFNDIKKLEGDIKEKLFTTDDQRTLEKLSRHIDILIGLVNIKLLNGDYEYFENNKSGFSHEIFSDFIKKKTIQYGLAYEMDDPNDAVARALPKLEDFYAIAIKRDKALVDNTLGQMKKDKLQVAVLVTGGFHSEGMSKLLEKQGVSYMVVCPSITKDLPTPYIQILTNQRTPIQDILVTPVHASEGQDVERGDALAPPSRTAIMSMKRSEREKYVASLDAATAEGLKVTLEEFEPDFLSACIMGRTEDLKFGGVVVWRIDIPGYIRTRAEQVGVSKLDNGYIVNDLMRQAEVRCNRLGMSSSAKRAYINALRAQLPRAIEEKFAKMIRIETERKAAQKGRSYAAVRGITPDDPAGFEADQARRANAGTPGRQAMGLDANITLEPVESDLFNRVLVEFFDDTSRLTDGRLKTIPLYIDGVEFDFQRHEGLIDALEKKGLDLRKAASVHPGRGGPAFHHELLQSHIDAYIYDNLTEEERMVVARHELAHIIIANGFTGKVDKSGRPYRDYELYKKYAAALNNALMRYPNLVQEPFQEYFVDQLPTCNTTDIRKKVARLMNARAKAKDAAAKVDNAIKKNAPRKISQDMLERIVAVDMTLQRGSADVKKMFEWIISKRRDAVGGFAQDYLAHRSQLDAIEKISGIPTQTGVGYGAYIFVSSTDNGARFWQERFEKGRGQILPKDAVIISISEENWKNPDGASNGFGTFNGWQRANKMYESMYDEKYRGAIDKQYGKRMSLMDLCRDKGVLMMHMAGKGTRMQPLAVDNKSAIKLPGQVIIDGRIESLTVGESVAMNFGLNVRPKRLTLAWGDQNNIPSTDISSSDTHLAEIFSVAVPIEGREDTLPQKGLLAPTGRGTDILQREKLPIEDIRARAEKLGRKDADMSLGFNSFRWELLECALKEFEQELLNEGKPNGQMASLNIDSDFWGPFTSTQKEYIDFVRKNAPKEAKDKAEKAAKKGQTFDKDAYIAGKLEWAPKHWERVRKIFETAENRVNETRSTDKKIVAFDASRDRGVMQGISYGTALSRVSDISNTSEWWDWGIMADAYNSLAILLKQPKDKDYSEAWQQERLRRYFRLPSRENWTKGSTLGSVEVKNSMILNSTVRKGRVTNSIVINSVAEVLNIDNAIVIGSFIYLLDAKGKNIITDVVAEKEETISLEQEEVLSAHYPGRQVRLYEYFGKEIIEGKEKDKDIGKDYGATVTIGTHHENAMSAQVLSEELKNISNADREISKARAIVHYFTMQGLYEELYDYLLARVKGSGLKLGILDLGLLPEIRIEAMHRLIEQGLVKEAPAVSGSFPVVYQMIFGLHAPDAQPEVDVLVTKFEAYAEMAKTHRIAKMGTSGIRGVADEESDQIVLTDMETYINKKAELEYLKDLDRTSSLPSDHPLTPMIRKGVIKLRDYIALGGDRRKHTARILIAHAVAILDAGFNVDYQGLTPTPSLANFGFNVKKETSMEITASHNPEDQNGSKTNSSYREMLKPEEPALQPYIKRVRWQVWSQSQEESYFNKKKGMFKSTGELEGDQKKTLLQARSTILINPEGEVNRNNLNRAETVTALNGKLMSQANAEFMKRFAEAFDYQSKPLEGMKIVFWQQSTVGNELYPDILELLGATVYREGRSEEFVPVDTENLSEEHKKILKDLVKKYNADAVLSADGDADRPVVCDENGNFIFGDKLGVLTDLYLGLDFVAAPVTGTTTAINVLRDKKDVKVVETNVGSPFVIDAMEAEARDLNAKARRGGFEVNGGFLLHSSITLPNGRSIAALGTRDAFLPMICVLMYAKQETPQKGKISLSRLVNSTFTGKKYTGDRASGLVQNLPGKKPAITPGCEAYKPEMGPAIIEMFSPFGKTILSVTFEPNGSMTFIAKDKPLESQEADHLLGDHMRYIQQRLGLFISKLPGLAGVPISRINYQDGLRVYMRNGEIVHFRPSGNAAQFRIYAEAASEARAQAIVDAAVLPDSGVLVQLIQDYARESVIDRATPLMTLSATPGRFSVMPKFDSRAVSPRDEGSLTPYITQTIDMRGNFVQNGQVDDEILRTLAAQVYRNNVKVDPRGQPAVDQSLNSSDYAIIERIIKGVKNRLAAERTQTSRSADSFEGVSTEMVDEVTSRVIQSVIIPEDIGTNTAAQAMLRDAVVKNISKADADRGLVDYITDKIIQGVNAVRIANKVDAQAVTVRFLAQYGIRAGIDTKTGALVIETPNAYLDRGQHDATYAKDRRVVSDSLVVLPGLFNEHQLETQYDMNHGIVGVPAELAKFGTNGKIHDTFFPQVSPLFAGSMQYQATGAHYQANAFDIKYVTEGKGVQYLVKFDAAGKVVDTIRQEMVPGAYVYALPGYVDVVVNKGGLRFTDISYELTDNEAAAFGVDTANRKALEALATKGMPHVLYMVNGRERVAVNPDRAFKGNLGMKGAQGVQVKDEDNKAIDLLNLYKSDAPRVADMMSVGFLNEVLAEISKTSTVEMLVTAGVLGADIAARAAAEAKLAEMRNAHLPIQVKPVKKSDWNLSKWGHPILVKKDGQWRISSSNILARHGLKTPEDVIRRAEERGILEPGASDEEIAEVRVAEELYGAGEIVINGIRLPVPAGMKPEITAKELDAADTLSLQSHEFDETFTALADGWVFLAFKKDIQDGELLLRELLTGEVEDTLHRVPVHKGDVVSVPAGTPHAYAVLHKGDVMDLQELKKVTAEQDRTGTQSLCDRLKLEDKRKDIDEKDRVPATEVRRNLAVMIKGMLPVLPERIPTDNEKYTELTGKILAVAKAELQANYGYTPVEADEAVRKDKDALTMTREKIDKNIASIKKTAENPEKFKVAKMVVNVSDSGKSTHELLSDNPGFTWQRYTIAQGETISADYLSVISRVHRLVVESGEVEVIDKATGDPKATIRQGEAYLVEANKAGQYDILATKGPAVVYSDYSPTHAGELLVTSAYQAMKRVIARPDQKTFTMLVPKGIYNGNDFIEDKNMISQATGGRVTLRQYDDIGEIINVNPETDVIIATEIDITRLEKDKDGKINMSTKTARILPISSKYIIDIKKPGSEHITGYARELEAIGIILGNTETKDITDNGGRGNERGMELYNLLRGRTEISNISKLTALINTDPNNPVAINERLANLLKLPIMVPFDVNREIDSAVKSRRQALWSA